VTVEDDLALRRLIAEYCQLIDDGEFTRLAELFTPDGCFAFEAEAPTGHEALARWFEQRQPVHRRGRHVSVNPIIDVDGDRARVASDFLFVRWIKGTLTIEMAGRYVDRCVRSDGRWSIERRDVEIVTPPVRP